VPARLRFQEQGEGRIAADVDPRDRVHLHGDVELAVSGHAWISFGEQVPVEYRAQ
jgi:hypothetical protein